MIVLNGLNIKIDSISYVKREGGIAYAYTDDYIKISLTEEEYRQLKYLKNI